MREDRSHPATMITILQLCRSCRPCTTNTAVDQGYIYSTYISALKYVDREIGFSCTVGLPDVWILGIMSIIVVLRRALISTVAQPPLLREARSRKQHVCQLPATRVDASMPAEIFAGLTTRTGESHGIYCLRGSSC